MTFHFVVGFCLRFAFCSCHAFHIMCIAFAYVFVSCVLAFFPVVRFAIQHSYVLRRPPLVSRCEWVLNFLGMDCGLSNGLGTPPVDRLSSFVPFGVRLILQRLTGKPQSLFCLQPNTPPKWPKIHPNPLHALGRSITIAWPKTAPHLDSPSSQNL